MFVWQFWAGMIIGMIFIMLWMFFGEIRYQIKLDERMSRDAFKMLELKSGLSRLTCYRLIDAGWRYEERLNEPSRWVNPMASLKNLNT